MQIVKKTLKTGVLALSGSAMILSAGLTSANAHDYGYSHYHHHGSPVIVEKHVYKQHHHHHHHQKRVVRKKDNTGAAIAAGIVGLAAGAVILGTLNNNRQQRYVAPRHAPQVYHQQRTYQPQGYQAPRVVEYDTRPQPWTQEWYSYCASKYRSFNPQTGRFLTYSGQYKLCR